MNKICDVCGNTRKIVKYDIIAKRPFAVPCPKCYGGVLLPQKKESKEGVYCEPQTGILHYFYYRTTSGEKYATMQTIIDMVKPQNDSLSRYLIANILSMKTEKMHRGLGYMRKVLQAVMNFSGGAVKFIITSWDDSKPAGRGFLLNNGFNHEKNVLIWRRDKNGTELHNTAA